jgi:hypothetical protein
MLASLPRRVWLSDYKKCSMKSLFSLPPEAAAKIINPHAIYHLLVKIVCQSTLTSGKTAKSSTNTMNTTYGAL